jgi:hypothetical protein
MVPKAVRKVKTDLESKENLEHYTNKCVRSLDETSNGRKRFCGKDD